MRAGDFDWSDLTFFLAVARAGRLTAAAARLKVEHSTVSRRIGALEEALGAKLFDRRPHGYGLTAAGERLMAAAEGMETLALAAQGEIGGADLGVAGTVRIGAPDGLGNYFLAAELGALAALHPDLVVELVPLPRTFSLSRREADLAIVLDRPTEGRLLVSRLIDYTLSVYAARAYLERHGTPSTVEDLAGHVVVTGVEDLAYASALDYSGVLEKHGRSRFRCASVMGQMEAVRAGAGIGVLHDFAAGRHLDAQGPDALVRILPGIGFRRSYFLLAHPDTVQVRRIAVLREVLALRFREERHHFIVP